MVQADGTADGPTENRKCKQFPGIAQRTLPLYDQMVRTDHQMVLQKIVAKSIEIHVLELPLIPNAFLPSRYRTRQKQERGRSTSVSQGFQAQHLRTYQRQPCASFWYRLDPWEPKCHQFRKTVPFFLLLFHRLFHPYHPFHRSTTKSLGRPPLMRRCG